MMIHLNPCHRGKVKLLVAALAACGCAQAAPPDPALARQIDEVVSQVGNDRLPGAVVLVARHGETVFRKAYGWADIDRRQPMEAAVSMPIGSVTKQFTAAAIMMLAEEGKLFLTDSVAQHLPEFAPQLRDVSIEQLLTHTSGVPDYTRQWRFLLLDRGDEISLPDLLGRIKGKSLDFAPGTRFEYSNSNYVLLGAIIEKVSGQPYGKFMEERIFVPLGLGNTAYGGYERAASMRAKGYEADGGKYSKPKSISMSMAYAAGGLVSTVDDLARWDNAITSGKLLKGESWQRVFSPARLQTGEPSKYGYGWGLGKLQGATAYSHGGEIYGFSSFVERLPEQGIYVAVLANASGDVTTELLAQRVAAVALGKPVPQYRKITLSKSTLEEFAGTYRSEEGTVRTVKRDGDHLVIERSGAPMVEIFPYSDNAFFVRDSLSQAEFVRDPQGRVVELLLTRNGNVTRNGRVATKKWWPL